MDFQGLLNLLKGNLGGAGMKTAEDGSAVHGGYSAPAQPPQTPMSVDNVITNGLVKTGVLPQSRAEIYPNPDDQPNQGVPVNINQASTSGGMTYDSPYNQDPYQAPPKMDFQSLLRGLLGQ